MSGSPVTVQDAVEAALQRLTGGAAVRTFVSSRTDVGVHAYANTLHFDLTRITRRGEPGSPYSPEDVFGAMNYHLRAAGHPIQVVDVRVVPPTFHCRYDAIHREYVYRIFHNTKDHVSLFEEGRAYFLPERLDVDSMREAASYLVGEHNFTSFRGMACEASSPVRRLDILEVKDRRATSSDFMRNERYLTVTGRARSFLHRQMRIMVGFLVAVGKGKEAPERAKELLELCDRSTAPATAPAHGLYLKWIAYDWEKLNLQSRLSRLAATHGDDWAQAAAEDVARRGKSSH